jgi:HTH-type transcriptional regulator, sugar sensing transcriptional regulator
MLWQVLNQAGLTEKESKVYLSLLEIKNQPASTIAQKIGVNRTSCYLVLNSLISKGLITSIKKQNTTIYQAAAPTSILTYIQKQKNELIESENVVNANLQFLQSINEKDSQKPIVKFYQGETSILNLYLETLNNKEKFIYSFLNFDNVPKKIYDLINKEYLPKRIEKQISANIISVNKETYLTDKEDNKINLRDVKFITNEFPFKVEIQVFDNKTIIINPDDNKLFGVLIENQEIADTIKALHKTFWNLLS